MRNRSRLTVLLLLLGCTMVGMVRADSMWDRRDYGSAFLFVDTRARRVGDLVTIAIVENTGIDNRDVRDAKKETKTGANFDISGTSTGVYGSRNFAANLAGLTSSQRELKGNSQYNVNQVFTDKITATVVNVLPNGNLVVEGSRTRVVGGESRTLAISGIVRPIDISPTNVVLSQFVGDCRITYLGRGDQSAYTNNGWLGRFFNVIWPW